MTTVRIPTPLRSLTGGADLVTAEGESVGQVLRNLVDAYPGIGDRLYDEAGNVRRFVNVFVGDEDIRALAGLETAVGEGDTISLVPAIAGGDR